jgi:tyrosine-protein phosphatase YwqE
MILLRKQMLIETSNEELKKIVQIEHFRHCYFNNFIAKVFSDIAAYCFFEKKLAIDLNLINDEQLTIF